MNEFGLVSWRREIAALYENVRGIPDPAAAHRRWRAGRDKLFREHSQSPLRDGDPLRESGLPYWPYDAALRFELPVQYERDGPVHRAETGKDGDTRLRRIGFIHLPAPIDAKIALWWLEQYAGGLFLPLRDATASKSSYGGGRYLLDTAKGADLGGESGLIVDLNFLYHPSCRYSAEWSCPLPTSDNIVAASVHAGERLSAIDQADPSDEEFGPSDEEFG